MDITSLVRTGNWLGETPTWIPTVAAQPLLHPERQQTTSEFADTLYVATPREPRSEPAAENHIIMQINAWGTRPEIEYRKEEMRGMSLETWKRFRAPRREGKALEIPDHFHRLGFHHFHTTCLFCSKKIQGISPKNQQLFSPLVLRTHSSSSQSNRAARSDRESQIQTQIESSQSYLQILF